MRAHACVRACVLARTGSQAPLAPSPTPPAASRRHRQVDSVLSLFIYLNHPELAVNSALSSGPALSLNITNILLIILWDRHRI